MHIGLKSIYPFKKAGKKKPVTCYLVVSLQSFNQKVPSTSVNSFFYILHSALTPTLTKQQNILCFFIGSLTCMHILRCGFFCDSPDFPWIWAPSHTGRRQIHLETKTGKYGVVGTYQCCESGFGLDPDSLVSLDPNPDPGGHKWSTKIEKKLINLIFEYSMFSFEG